MTELSSADHLFAGMLALLSLALATGKIAKPSFSDRSAFYRSASASSLLLSGCAIMLWVASERPLASYGLAGWLGDPRFTVPAALAWAAALLAYVRAVRRGFLRDQLAPIYARLADLMPRTRRELSASWMTSICAGTGEEIIYRGFLLWYATSLVGVAAGVLATSLLFGAAHGYQSRWGMTFATFAGLILAAAYLVSGSLLLVIWMHGSYNMASFFIGSIVAGVRSSPAGRSGGPSQHRRPMI